MAIIYKHKFGKDFKNIYASFAKDDSSKCYFWRLVEGILPNGDDVTALLKGYPNVVCEMDDHIENRVEKETSKISIRSIRRYFRVDNNSVADRYAAEVKWKTRSGHEVMITFIQIDEEEFVSVISIEIGDDNSEIFYPRVRENILKIIDTFDAGGSPSSASDEDYSFKARKIIIDNPDWNCGFADF